MSSEERNKELVWLNVGLHEANKELKVEIEQLEEQIHEIQKDNVSIREMLGMTDDSSNLSSPLHVEISCSDEESLWLCLPSPSIQDNKYPYGPEGEIQYLRDKECYLIKFNLVLSNLNKKLIDRKEDLSLIEKAASEENTNLYQQWLQCVKEYQQKNPKVSLRNKVEKKQVKNPFNENLSKNILYLNRGFFARLPEQELKKQLPLEPNPRGF